jgi:hypothetical protein
MESREVTTRLQTALGASELVAHYAPQLASAGWALGGAVRREGGALQTATLRDQQGRAWHGILMATEIPTTREREVLFRILRATDPAR